MFEYVNLIQENQVDIKERIGKDGVSSMTFHFNLSGRITNQGLRSYLEFFQFMEQPFHQMDRLS